MRVAVIGLGGTGSAAARFLAAAGHSVVAYEQFAVGHARGSSHGESRIIRKTYPDSFLTAMMIEAYDLWADLESAARAELFVRTGGLYFGPRDLAELHAVETALVEQSVPFSILSPADVASRFPAIRLASNEVAIHQSDSGFLRASRVVAANVALAKHHGAAVRENSPVVAIENRGASVVVTPENGTAETFDTAVITAGPWTQKMLAMESIPLRVSRQEIAYLALGANTDRFSPSRCPVWIDANTHHYGFPSDGQIAGIKIALHHPGPTFDPNEPDRPVDPAATAALVEYAARRLPDLAPRVVFSEGCLYTNTPDEQFVIDAAPGLRNVWVVTGCSGHGFKFTVLLGKIAAELATQSGPARDLSRFGLARFRLM